MRVAYFSPLNPQRSGISDYSEELLPYLAENAEITLFVDGFQPSNRELLKSFGLVDYRRKPVRLDQLKEFDAVVYHIGNDHRFHAGIFDALRRHRGIVVFHDFALQDFFLGLARERKNPRLYLDEVEACQGEQDRRLAETSLLEGRPPTFLKRPTDFPLNARLARGAEGIIVHSEWSQTRFRQIAPGVPIARIPMPTKVIASSVQPPEAELNPSCRKIGIACFGLIIPGKGIDQILRVLSTLRTEYDFHFTLVGAENPYFDVRSLISAYRMTDRVTVTGHVSLEEFQRQIRSADIAINLRERTVGETSASLCRIMAAGVPVIVSNVGSFAELPDNAVIKIEHDHLADRMLRAFLQKLMQDPILRQRIGSNARQYVITEHDIKLSADRYLRFIRDVVRTRAQRSLLDSVTGELLEMGTNTTDTPLLQSLAAEIATLAPVAAFTTKGGHQNGRQAYDSTSKLPITREVVIDTGVEENIDVGSSNQRLSKIEGLDYKRAAIEYASKLDPERYHYLFTKPFYNLANKPPKHLGEGMDAETFRHFCDFANLAVALTLPAGKRILDVGCGSGWLSEFFARLGYDVTGIDISPELTEIATKRLSSLKYDADHQTPVRCRFLVHDVESGPLNETFDAVVCYDSLHHFEDERAVVKNLATMTAYGGVVFILEGDRPEEGSATEEELINVMRRYQTLESPFSRSYLRTLLDEQGLAVIGDYVSVNGLFERTAISGDCLRVSPPDVNYLLCKKVVLEPGRPASSVLTSLQASALQAELTIDQLPSEVESGSVLRFSLLIKNTGNGLWLVGPAERAGSVMLGLRLLDRAGLSVSERHGTPPLPHAIAAGESVKLRVELRMPSRPGEYTLKIDMVAQHVCWFEDNGSTPLVLPLQIV